MDRSPAEIASRLEVLLAAVPDGELRVLAARRALDELSPADAVEVLARLLRHGGERDSKGAAALAATTQAIAPVHCSEARRTSLREAANALGLAEVASLVSSFPAHRSFGARDEFHDPSLSELTLGHRKALARSRDPDVLLRLGMVGEASVLRNLLVNPRFTEAMAVRLASRRPMAPEALSELSRSRRFLSSLALRRALVRNPYTPVDVALRLVPLLLAPEWRELASDSSVHERVRTESLRLLAARGGREQRNAERYADPETERVALETARQARVEARRRAEAEARAREEAEAHAEMLGLLASFEEKGFTLVEVRDPRPAPAGARALRSGELPEDDE